MRDAAARLRDKLAAALGDSEVFMDVDNLLAGERFDLKLKEALAGTEIFLAVIGPRWMELFEARMESGERDYVREEIAAALAAQIPVIPVLMDRAPLPKAASLPEDIRELVLYHAHGIVYESFGRDVQALIEAIEVHRRTRAQQAGEAARRAADAERQTREETARLAAGKERAAKEAARLAREREVAEAARLAQEKRQAEAEARRLANGARGDAEGSHWKSFAIVLAVLATIGGGIQVYRWSRPPEPGLVPTPALAQPFKPAPAPVVPPRGETCDGVLVDAAADGKRCIKPGSGQSFKDCENCPEMVVAPAGSFTMGSPEDEKERQSSEEPAARSDLCQAVCRWPLRRDFRRVGSLR